MKRMARHTFNLVFLVALLGLVASAQTQPVSNAQGSTPTSSLGDYARQVHKDTGHKPRSFDNDNLPKDDKLSIVGSSDNAGAGEQSAAPTTDETSTPKTEEPAASKASESTTTPDSEAKTEGKSAKSGNHSSPEGKPKSAAPSGSGSEAEAAAPVQPKAEAKPAEEKAAAAAPTPSSPDQDANAKQAEWKQWGQKINSEKEQIDLAERELNVLQREYQIRAAAMYGDAGNRLRNQADWDKQDAQYKQQLADKQKAVEDAKQKLDDMQEDARRAGVPESVREPD
jgi:hypothetical protein